MHNDPEVPKDYAADFDLLVAAAVAGKRCPMTWPDGPLKYKAIPALYRADCIRSELYGQNFRRVTILVGEHRGNSTKSSPNLGPPWKVNGKLVRDLKLGRGNRPGFT